MYALASKITFICQMDFNAFPVDIQVDVLVFGYLVGLKIDQKINSGLQISCWIIQLSDEQIGVL